MSKTIIIERGGTPETWEDLSKLRTGAIAGGSMDWQPEDECTTGTITITANGEYSAADDGLYGYSKAIVNVPDAVRGTINDVEYIVTVDANGNLVETPVED